MTQLPLDSGDADKDWLAVISACEQYRYVLRRRLSQQSEHGTILWLMCNPSTADHHVLDPTVRRCVDFSKRWGFGVMAVGNLYALRSPKPAVLWTVDDPVGPSNDFYIRGLVAEASTIVAAWGTDPKPTRAFEVLAIIGESKQVFCLGTSKSGAPRHPLYIKGVTPLIPYTR